MSQERNIFQELKDAMVVGGLDTSMQSPDLNEEVLELALKGEFTSNAVLLHLHYDAHTFKCISVEELQAARYEGHGWELPSGECLWIN